MHHLFLEPWKQRFPAAKLYGPRSLQKKRPDLDFDELLADEPPAAWGGAFEQRALEGTRYLKEIAFYHKQSRTLILTDHIFHFGDRWPLGTRIAMRAIGAYKKAAWPRDFGLIIKDRSALEAALKTVLAWDFDRIVISHGDIVEQDGKRALREAYQMSNA